MLSIVLRLSLAGSLYWHRTSVASVPTGAVYHAVFRRRSALGVGFAVKAGEGALPGIRGGGLLGETIRVGDAEMLVRAAGGDPATRRALQETELDQVRLVDIHDCVRLLARRRRHRLDADRAAIELINNCRQDTAVGVVQAEVVNIEHGEGAPGDLRRRNPIGTYLRVVADALEETVRDAGRAAGTAGDLRAAVRL